MSLICVNKLKIIDCIAIRYSWNWPTEVIKCLDLFINVRVEKKKDWNTMFTIQRGNNLGGNRLWGWGVGFLLPLPFNTLSRCFWIKGKGQGYGWIFFCGFLTNEKAPRHIPSSHWLIFRKITYLHLPLTPHLKTPTLFL